MHVSERQPGDIQQRKRLIRQENNAKHRDRSRIALPAIEGRAAPAHADPTRATAAASFANETTRSPDVLD